MHGRSWNKGQAQPLQSQQGFKKPFIWPQKDQHITDIGSGQTGQHNTGGPGHAISHVSGEIVEQHGRRNYDDSRRQRFI